MPITPPLYARTASATPPTCSAHAWEATARATPAAAAPGPPPRMVNSPVPLAPAFKTSWHASTALVQYAHYAAPLRTHRKCHAPHVLSACMGGYSSCHPGCSRTRAATTHGEQPCTSSTRVQDQLARIHSPCAVCPLRRPSTHAPQVPRPPRAQRMHGRLQLVPPRLQPHQGRHHAW